MTPTHKTRSLRRIESAMETLDRGSYRYRVLNACRSFKNSWMELGEVLFSVQRDKLYREWGFVSFDSYCNKELGIKRPTAAKLLKSYAFLEREAPEYIQKAKSREDASTRLPDLDAINLLRLAKSNKHIEEDRYDSIRKDVFDDARDTKDLRREIRFLIHRNTDEEDPRKARFSRRQEFLNRTVHSLERIFREAEAAHFWTDDISNQVERLIRKIKKASQT